MRLALALLCLAAPALAQGLDDRHLPVIPRTAADQAAVATLLAPPADLLAPEPAEARSAGAATVGPGPAEGALGRASANLPPEREMDFALGNTLFRKLWVAAPAPTKASDGLGPLWNARSCHDCHLGDGRGWLPLDGEVPVGLVVKTGVPGGPVPDGIDGWIATGPDPVYGSQYQTTAAPGQTAEARLTLAWTRSQAILADGTVVPLRRPAFALTDLAHGAAHPGAALSPRLAPPMIGLGLLEAIPAADILAREDPFDLDGDGISGRAQIVPSAEFGLPMLGRFGFKAMAPTLREQSAHAFAADMGLSTVLFPDPAGDCTPAQTACRTAPHGRDPGLRDGHEVDTETLDLVTFYSRNLGVPERRDVADPLVLRGKSLFHAAGCADCHTPKHVTHRLQGQPEQSFQLIWPYTDLLLHDMGPGLADGLPEGRATGSEWRTPPLWGLGLSAQVSGRVELLHDGRAESVLAAILWHGGEAQAARDRVAALSAQDRAALLAFLDSL